MSDNDLLSTGPGQLTSVDPETLLVMRGTVDSMRKILESMERQGVEVTELRLMFRALAANQDELERLAAGGRGPIRWSKV